RSSRRSRSRAWAATGRRTSSRSSTSRRCKGRTGSHPMRLSGRTILVTGGASGLGGATVDAIVAAGGRAVVLDLNGEAARARAASHGPRVRAVPGDVTREADVQAAIDAALHELDGLH